MASPYLYAALSIIPGLGMLALKEYRKGVITFGIILLFGILYFLSNSEILLDMLFGLLIFSWIGQISYTYQLAQRQYNQETGDSDLKPSYKIEVPSNLSRKEKNMYRITEQIRQQLNGGESLKVGMRAMQQSKYITGLSNDFLLGITDRDMIMVKIDWMGKPLEVSRYSLDEIVRFKISKSAININSKVQFWFVEKKKPLKLQISGMLHSDGLEVLKETFAHVTK